MKVAQIKNAFTLFFAQFIIKGSNFLKQIVLAYFLGVSEFIDLFLIAQIIPNIIASMFCGGTSEIILTAQTDDKVQNSKFNTLFIAVVFGITVLALGIYYGLLDFTVDFYQIKSERVEAYLQLSVIVILSKIITSVSTSAHNLVLLENKYKLKVLANFLAEFAGLAFIISTVQSLEIFSFAYALLINATILFFFYGFYSRLNILYVFQRKVWVEQGVKIKMFTKKMINLSGQTLVNHLSTLSERTLSARYLYDGYLSSLNYAKTLAALPSTMLLSSILTTTYIEQINKYKEDTKTYETYTHNTQKFIEKLGFFAQISLILLAPLMIILIYKRGQFDDTAILQTFQLYQVLSVGFISSYMMSFFTRTMFIENQYKKLFRIILVKLVVEFSIMFLFVKHTPLSIPLAIIIGNFWVTMSCFLTLKKHKQEMFNYRSFYLTLVMSIGLSVLIALFNFSILPTLTGLSKTMLVAVYSPLMILIVALFVYLFKDYTVVAKVLRKVKLKKK